MAKKDLQAMLNGARKASDVLKVLSHELRLLAVCHIGWEEKTVQELEVLLGTSQSNISQHLSKLRDKGILDCRKVGNQVYYRVLDKRALELISVLQSNYC